MEFARDYFFQKFREKQIGSNVENIAGVIAGEDLKKEKAEQADDIGLFFDRKVFRLVGRRANKSLWEKRGDLNRCFKPRFVKLFFLAGVPVWLAGLTHGQKDILYAGNPENRPLG